MFRKLVNIPVALISMVELFRRALVCSSKVPPLDVTISSGPVISQVSERTNGQIKTSPLVLKTSDGTFFPPPKGDVKRQNLSCCCQTGSQVWISKQTASSNKDTTLVVKPATSVQLLVQITEELQNLQYQQLNVHPYKIKIFTNTACIQGR